MMMATKAASEHIEESLPAGPLPAESISVGGMEKTITNIENDPHRAALEDNPDEPERLGFVKALAIFVCSPSTRRQFLACVW